MSLITPPLVAAPVRPPPRPWPARPGGGRAGPRPRGRGTGVGRRVELVPVEGREPRVDGSGEHLGDSEQDEAGEERGGQDDRDVKGGHSRSADTTSAAKVMPQREQRTRRPADQ